MKHPKDIVMKPFIVISVLLALSAICQKCRQSDVNAFIGCPATKTELYANPQSEPAGTDQTGHSGKFYVNGLIIL
jgi:hypothetical protein